VGSGQRVALAVLSPKRRSYLLLDKPLLGVDKKVRQDYQFELRIFSESTGPPLSLSLPTTKEKQ